IQRYRLEKKDPGAGVSEAVQPIVFFISPEVPQEWRSYIKRGIEDWKPLLESAGFRDAIIARDAPAPEEDPHWHPEDVRHNVVRWTPSGRQNATGPAVIDPRSGEVISSHVILWHDVLRLVETWYFTQASPSDPRGRQIPLPRDIIGEVLRYVVSHEVGHSLGLRHNFKGHSSYSVARLRDKEWTQRWGNSASIMDYSRLNYVAQPGDGAYLLPRFGPYDYFAIEWGYRQFTRAAARDGKGEKEVINTDAEMELLDELAAKQVDDPLLRFGGEDESANLDPAVNTNVIGADPIEAAQYGLRNIDRVMPYLISGTTRLGGDYARLQEMYEALIQHRHRQLSAVAKLVGGVEETRYHARRGGPPFKAVPANRQRAAVRFLVDRAFSVPNSLLDKEVLRRIGPTGGADGLQGSNVKLLRQLLSDGVFQRMAEAQSLEPADKHYTGIEMLRDLNNGLFKELASVKPVTEAYRRELQRNYVTLMLVAAGAQDDPESSSQDIESSSPSLQVEAMASHPQAKRSASSPLPEVAQQYRAGILPSEARTMLLAGISHLHHKIEMVTGKVRDPVTAAHLRDLKTRLGRAL
ncbi:MAG: zinc-dependent metalloprotease, partial [Burkholderiales bacterium]